MGRRRITGDGESAERTARSSLRTSAGRLRTRLSARGNCILRRVSALGMAADVLHRRTAGAPRRFRPNARSGVGSLEGNPSDELDGNGPRDSLELEAVPLSHCADGGNEPGVAWNAGHVSDLRPARVGLHAARACDTGWILDDWRANR